MECGLGLNCLAKSPLHRQIIAARYANIDMRIHALAIALPDGLVNVPGDQRRNLVMLNLRPVGAGHPILAGKSAAPPPNVGRYWRNFSRAWNMRAFTVPTGQSVIAAISSRE